MFRSLWSSRKSRNAGVLVLAGLFALVLGQRSVWGDITYTPTRHSQYQAVYDDGTSAWPSSGPKYPVEMIGVVIHNPWDMLDWNMGNYSSSATPQWQVFFQAVAQSTTIDWGGTAMYMRRFHPGSGTNLYPGTAWNDEMDRLNYPVYELTGERVTDPLRQGDLIRVQANAPGMAFNGKNNINTQHSSDPAKQFSITIIERDVTPFVSHITLADLKDGNNNFIFDEDRLTGGERYQGSLVHLNDLLLDDDPAKWYLNNIVTVRQGDLTFDMQLGIDPALGSIDPFALTTKPFSVTAILNQEDGSAPFTAGYRLWLTNAGNLSMVPEPSAWVLAMLGTLMGWAVLRRTRRVGA